MAGIYRRKVLTLLALSCTGSGCLTINNSERILNFGNRNITERNDEIIIQTEISISITLDNRNEEWGVFHNVELVGYSDTGEPICRKELGTITEERDGETVDLHCPEYPKVIQYEASESPCEEDTTIDKLVRREIEGNIVYSPNKRECGGTP